MKLYGLEIYEPGSADDVVAYFESDNPFGAITKGDLINPLATEGEKVKRVLRVVGVEHIIWEVEAEGVKYKTCIFTAAEENNREARMK